LYQNVTTQSSWKKKDKRRVLKQRIQFWQLCKLENARIAAVLDLEELGEDLHSLLAYKQPVEQFS